eukprot:jgi/Phyca11/19964/fgenesh1_pg.PHYCAscaffold_54_\
MTHGVEFYPLGGDPKELAAYMVKTGGHLIPTKIETLTKDKRNYISYKLVDLIMWHGTEGMINEFRTEVLKLRPIRNGDLGSELLLDLNIPHAFMWSPKLETASVYSPSPELEAFLGDDGGPIFVANPEMRARAEALQAIMEQEDGAEEGVRAFYRHLPTQDMWCDLDHQRIASQWSVHDRIKLCDRCAFLVKERQAKGLIKGGLVGGIKGTVADQAATGQKNANREEGQRKLNSVYDRRLMAALGTQDALVDAFCLAVGPNAVDSVIFLKWNYLRYKFLLQS